MTPVVRIKKCVQLAAQHELGKAAVWKSELSDQANRLEPVRFENEVMPPPAVGDSRLADSRGACAAR